MLFVIITVVSLYGVCVWAHTYGACVEVREQVCGVCSFLLPLYGYQELNLVYLLALSGRKHLYPLSHPIGPLEYLSPIAKLGIYNLQVSGSGDILTILNLIYEQWAHLFGSNLII